MDASASLCPHGNGDAARRIHGGAPVSRTICSVNSLPLRDGWLTQFVEPVNEVWTEHFLEGVEIVLSKNRNHLAQALSVRMPVSIVISARFVHYVSVLTDRQRCARVLTVHARAANVETFAAAVDY